MRSRRVAVAAVVMATAAALVPLASASIHPRHAVAAQPVPGHKTLVPSVPRTNLPRISDGEIWDIAVIGSNAYVAGTFTSIADTQGNTTPIAQASLASFNIDTGLINRQFRPTFDGGVNAVEASPDGTKLFVTGTFNTVNGVSQRKVASLDPKTGAPRTTFAFTKATDGAGNALAVTNTTVYVGGRFKTINGVKRTGLAAVNASTGAVDTGFDNSLDGGIGVGGTLTVQQLKLTHDESKLLVVHTGRKVAGQDRLGIAWIDTKTKQLLPWRTRLWDQYLPVVGGVQRLYNADISPDDSYFVVTSGSGGDRPPISDTAVAFPVAGGDDVQPLWVARCFDSVYSVAITEKAVYLGGHFSWNESPTANQPWPGLDNVGYGTGQGLSGYGLGDQVVRRDHLGALDPKTGTALPWNPGSNSFEGNKAMLAVPNGLLVGGDGMIQGGVRTGRVAFYDLRTAPKATPTNTSITTPIEGRVVPSGQDFSIQGTARSGTSVARVQVEVQDRDTHQYLKDDLTTWGSAFNTINATLGKPTNKVWPWSVNLNLTGTHRLALRARAVSTNGTVDPSKASKTIETFVFDDQTPNTFITGPSSPQPSGTFTMTGTATDDHGVSAMNYWFRDSNGEYLQDDGSVAPIFNTFRGLPDVVGATNATWSYDVTLPHDGQWRGSATAIDNAGQADLRSATKDWVISASTQAPVVTIAQPGTMTPPSTTPTVAVTPGSPVTFSGTAADSDGLRDVQITLRSTSTKDALAADGSWGPDSQAGVFRISQLDIPGNTYNWSWETPFNLPAGTYSFTVRATDDLGITTATTNRGSLTVLAQVPGDAFPDGLIDSPGTGQPSLPTSALNLTGTATDDKGVDHVSVAVYDQDTGRYLHPNNTLTAGFATLDATLGTPGGTSTTWSLSANLPGKGDFLVTAWAYDTSGQPDQSTVGATGRYLYFPGDNPPTFEPTLGQPVDNDAFTEGRIVVSGRAIDDFSIAKVEVAIVDSSNRYLQSNGTFAATEAWRAAFLNSPGSPGSNFSFTSPVVPDGTYSVLVRGTDQNDQIGPVRTASNVTVTHPVNVAPVANASFSCTQNVCSFNGLASTDEDPASLTYSWNFGTGQGTSTSPTPIKTFTAAGPFSVKLTVTDEWNVSSQTTLNVAPTEPTGNQAPNPVITTNCSALTCGVTSAGTTDPQPTDVITYTWDWGDGSPLGTGPAAIHTYATSGSHTITLTATDGWGKLNTKQAPITLP